MITFPPLRQDIAVVVPEEVEAAALVDVALEAGAPELREARVFDVYRGDQVGEGRKSVAIHLSLQAPDRTLSDDDAAVVRERIVAALTTALRRGAARAANRRSRFCVGGDEGPRRGSAREAFLPDAARRPP